MYPCGSNSNTGRSAISTNSILAVAVAILEGLAAALAEVIAVTVVVDVAVPAGVAAAATIARNTKAEMETAVTAATVALILYTNINCHYQTFLLDTAKTVITIFLLEPLTRSLIVVEIQGRKEKSF